MKMGSIGCPAGCCGAAGICAGCCDTLNRDSENSQPPIASSWRAVVPATHETRAGRGSPRRLYRRLHDEQQEVRHAFVGVTSISFAALAASRGEIDGFTKKYDLSGLSVRALREHARSNQHEKSLRSTNASGRSISSSGTIPLERPVHGAHFLTRCSWVGRDSLHSGRALARTGGGPAMTRLLGVANSRCSVLLNPSASVWPPVRRSAARPFRQNVRRFP